MAAVSAALRANRWVVHTRSFPSAGFLAWRGVAPWVPCDDHGVPGAVRDRGGVPEVLGRVSVAGGVRLPALHRAISNLKAWLHGTHRRASREHLQAYLDEFTFRHNRRGNPHAAFQTLLGLSTRHQPVSYRQIIDEAA